jgi:hypothetical protein
LGGRSPLSDSIGRRTDGLRMRPGGLGAEQQPEGSRRPPSAHPDRCPQARTAIKRIKEDLERGPGDKRFESEVGRLLFEKKLNDREAAAAFQVGEIYGYERLHARRRSAVSPSYSSGAPELADERMTADEIGTAVRE